MGNPVRIRERAERLAREAPEPVEIVYTGLRPGEKLHEDLFGVGEIDDRPVHPLISHVRVPPLDGGECAQLDGQKSPAEFKVLLPEVCQAVHPNGSDIAIASSTIVSSPSSAAVLSRNGIDQAPRISSARLDQPSSGIAGDGQANEV